MIHLDPHTGLAVNHLQGEVFDGKGGRVGKVKNGIQHYVYVLLPYPEDIADEFISRIIHGY